MRRALSLSAAVLCAVALTAARQSPQQPPQFRAGVDLVHLDVSVLDRQRRPVKGLTAADFEVFEDGRRQDVATFAAVEFPDAVPAPPTWMRDVPPDTRRNDTLEDRRLFVIVMDDGMAQANLAAQRSAKDAARAFIDRMGPQDLAAVIFTMRNQHAQDYTSDRSRLLAAVDKFGVGFRDMGDVPGGPDTDEFFYRSSVEVLRQVAEALIALPQRRKTLVYISQGVPVDPDAAGPVAIGPGNAIAVGSAGVQQLLIYRTMQVLEAAQRANVNVYTLDPCGLRAPPAMRPPAGEGMGSIAPEPTCVPGLEQEFLKDLAHATGGRAAVDMNDLTPAVDQIFVENGSYYLLGVRSDNTRREGKFRRLDVRVRRDDVEVRARSGYVEPSPDRERREAEAADAAPLRKAIAGLLPKGDVPLQVWAAPFPQAGRREARVAIGLGLRQVLAIRETSHTEHVDVTIQAFTPEGRSRQAQNLNATLNLRPGPAGEVAFEVVSSLELPPGRYQLRIGAFLRSTRTSGSVYYDLDVPDFTRPAVALSSLALHAAPPLPSAAIDATAWLPQRPTTARQFSAGDRLTALARIRRRDQRAADSIRWRASVVDTNDREVWTTDGYVSAQAVTNGLGDLSLELPIASWPSGAYLLTVELPGAAGDHTRSHVRFSVR